MLGDFYFYGRGVTQDYSRALEWWRMAANQGEALAQNGVGWIHLKCLGVKCDYCQAADWFRKSAEQGCEIAQINMGYVLENGKGVSVDYPEAQKWYRLATAHGNARAKKAMTSLAAIMTKKQLQESESRVLAWRQKRKPGDSTAESVAAIESSREESSE